MAAAGARPVRRRQFAAHAGVSGRDVGCQTDQRHCRRTPPAAGRPDQVFAGKYSDFERRRSARRSLRVLGGGEVALWAIDPGVIAWMHRWRGRAVARNFEFLLSPKVPIFYQDRSSIFGTDLP